MLRIAQLNSGTSGRIVLVATLLAAFSLHIVDARAAWAQTAPAATTQTAPAATTSRYMATIDGSTLYNEGCSQGRAGDNGIVVLDFGEPWVQGTTYGTILFDARGTFASTAQIENAVEQFLRGYWMCAPTNTFVRMGIGTSNYGTTTGAAHGRAWAALVDAVGAWIVSSPSYAAVALARGATDIEMAWNTPAATRAWVDGYAAVTNAPYYNYGDCEGCPTTGTVLPIPGRTTNHGWTQEDVWYVAYGALPAFPLPEIYLTNGVNATQWQQLSLYARENHGSSIYFLGAMTQYQACLPHGGCTGTNNSPSAGWTQLQRALNSDSRTAQGLNWSTDITWAN